MNPNRTQDEQEVLACLLWAPQEHGWELDGLGSGLFVDPTCRQIAMALQELRDSGKRVHWRRVRRVLNQRRQGAAASLVEPLVKALGTRCGLTAAVSRLHQWRARRAA